MIARTGKPNQSHGNRRGVKDQKVKASERVCNLQAATKLCKLYQRSMQTEAHYFEFESSLAKYQNLQNGEAENSYRLATSCNFKEISLHMQNPGLSAAIACGVTGTSSAIEEQLSEYFAKSGMPQSSMKNKVSYTRVGNVKEALVRRQVLHVGNGAGSRN